MKLDDRDAAVKTALDALLLKLPGVEGGEMTGLAAYFVNDRMFACIWNGAVGIRVPGTVATELQFSRRTHRRLRRHSLVDAPATRRGSIACCTPSRDHGGCCAAQACARRGR